MSTRASRRNRHRNPNTPGLLPVSSAVSASSAVPSVSASSASSAVPSVSAPSAFPNFSEIGFSGIQSWGGLIRDDYNPELCFPRSISVYEKMRKSDGQVQAIETVCSLPVRTVRYYVTPGGAGKADKDAADLVEENLINGVGLSHSFDDLVREALTALMMGYQIFEQCFVEVAGQIRWAKFASRHPRSLKNWVFGPSGAVEGFVQWGVDPGGSLRTQTIRLDKLLRYTYREEWGNPEGFPLSRPMYKHWKIIDSVYRAANVGIARDLVGTPKGQWPAGASDEDKRNFKEMLKSIAVGDSSAMAYGPGYEVDTYGGKSQPNTVMAYLKHHYEVMTRTALASFINLAGSGQGSNALSEDQSQFFLLCEEALATWICEAINVQAIPQLCGWNWPGMKVFPRLEHAHMGTILHPVAIAHALAALVNKLLLTPGLDIENPVRDMMNLPEIPADQVRPTPPPPAPGASPEPGGNPAAAEHGGSDFRIATPSPSAVAVVGAVNDREPSPSASPDLPVRNAIKPDLAKIKADLDEKQADFIAQAKAILDKVVAWAETNITQLSDEALTLPALQRGKVQTQLAALDLPYRGEYQDWMRSLFMGVVNAGMDQLRQSRRSGVSPGNAAQDDLVVPNELRSYVRALAQLTTDKHFEDLRFAVVTKAQRDIESRLGRDQVRFNTRQTLLDQANANLGKPFEDIIRAVTDQVAGVLLAVPL